MDARRDILAYRGRQRNRTIGLASVTMAPPRGPVPDKRNGSLSAMVFVASSALANGRNLAVPAGDPDGCEAIGTALGPFGPIRMVVGPRQACDAFWRGLGDPQARIRYEQRLYVCTEVTG